MVFIGKKMAVSVGVGLACASMVSAAPMRPGSSKPVVDLEKKSELLNFEKGKVVLPSSKQSAVALPPPPQQKKEGEPKRTTQADIAKTVGNKILGGK